MSSEELLRLYEGLGLRLLHWDRKGNDPKDWKGPRIEGWNHPKRQYPLDVYDPARMNLGTFTGHEIQPGKFLVDIDLDWAPGVVLARRLLPQTGLGFRRKGKKFSHVMYTTPERLDLNTYCDLTDDGKENGQGQTFVELRGGDSKRMTMIAPSKHSEDVYVELIEQAEYTISHVTVEGIRYAVVDYGIGCLILHRVPGGLHHDGRLALSGFLLSHGFEAPRVLNLLEAICEVQANSVPGMSRKDIDDCALVVATTEQRLKDGNKRIAGGPKFAEFCGARGKEIVTRMRQWMGASSNPLTSAIERLNERFAIVGVGNKVVVMETSPDGGIKTLWPFEEFRRLLIKERIEVEVETRAKTTTKDVELSTVWLAHKDGRRYDQLVYAMPGSANACDPNDYNGWLGFRVKPEPGDWSRNREHLRKIICGGDDKFFAWVWNWMAALVQWPGRHAFSAIVLRGGQGTGKGHFAHLMLGALFHKQQYLHIIGAGMLTGRFNEHLSGKVLVFADESTWGGDTQAADKLKGMVTESTIPIERKFLPLVEDPSALHIVIASNNDWPIAIAMDDRRFMVLDVADTKRQDDAYFAPLRDELGAGGLAAMLFDLQEHHIDEHALRHPPSSKGKREVMTQSLKPVERWWFEKLLRGSVDITCRGYDGEGREVTNEIVGWPAQIAKSDLHRDYLQFLDQLHRSDRTRRSTETELGMFLKKYNAGLRPLRLEGVTGDRAYAWHLPSLPECRGSWVKACGWPEDFKWEASNDGGGFDFGGEG